MTSPLAGVMHECALGYSGWFGVAGEQRATRWDRRRSPSLPSVSPAG